jgi:hypothetical protein
MEPKLCTAGRRVYWHDPDDDLCSGAGVIVEGTELDDQADNEHIIRVRKDDGGEVECTPPELEAAT